jgi:hypothetical protein
LAFPKTSCSAAKTISKSTAPPKSPAGSPPSPLEEIEKLEQLRVLSLGKRIQVGVVAHASRGVDTPADYDRFVADYRRSQAAAA